MKTSDPRHLLIAGLIGFATAVPVILGIQGCADREPVKPVVVVPDKPAPIPHPGFRVLVLEESGERDVAVQTMLHSLEVEGYLDSKCPKGDDGKTPEWRILDDDYTPEQQARWSPLWKAAYAKAKADSNGVRPWIIVSNGDTGASVPMPKPQAEFMALLRKYGE